MSDDYDCTPILDQFGNPFHTGLLQPAGNPENFVSSYQRLDTAMGIFTDAEVRAILADPNREPAEKEFDDHWVKEGDQKQHSSCAGWGGSNSFSKMRWRLGIRDGIVFSGSYVYSWCNRNQDNGSALEDIMNELMAHGTVPASDCPWNVIYRSSTKQFDSEAARHQGLALYSVKTQAEVNTAIARNQLVVVCVQVDRSQYVNYKGQGLVPAFNGSGNHCIHVDDLRWNSVSQQWEYRQVGNWGLTWGNRGTGWCRWNSFAQTIQNHSFYVLTSVNDLAA